MWSVGACVDALCAVAVVDEMGPRECLRLLLESRGVLVGRMLGECEEEGVMVLGSLEVSQMFGEIPNPDEEVKMWMKFREKLEGLMVVLDKEFIAKACLDFLRSCGREIMNKIWLCLRSVANNHGMSAFSSMKVAIISNPLVEVLLGLNKWQISHKFEGELIYISVECELVFSLEGELLFSLEGGLLLSLESELLFSLKGELLLSLEGELLISSRRTNFHSSRRISISSLQDELDLFLRRIKVSLQGELRGFLRRIYQLL
ncbi:conserved oligomeric Golgi complex subunit 1 [Tanacetum coccineum]